MESPMTSPRSHYLMVVTAMSQRYQLASFSNWGDPVWFTAPGVDIYCTDKDGQAACVNGTSFASPLLAGIAAMILEKAPGMTSQQVEALMIKSCAGKGWNTEFGYGLPRADLCMSYLKAYSRGTGEDEPQETVSQPIYEGTSFELEKAEPSDANSENTDKKFVPPPAPPPDEPSFATND